MHLTTLFLLHTLYSILHVLKTHMKNEQVETGGLEIRDVLEGIVYVWV